MTTGTERRPETKGRSTLYKGIRMRSRIEADYAGYLDRRGRQWKYEPDCFADERGQWLPDFRIAGTSWADGGPDHLVEVKPAELLEPREDECPYCVVRRVDAIVSKVRPAWKSEPESIAEVVFWKYGAPCPSLALVGGRNTSWMAHHLPGIPFPMLWIGAGQRDAIAAYRDEHAAHEPLIPAPQEAEAEHGESPDAH